MGTQDPLSICSRQKIFNTSLRQILPISEETGAQTSLQEKVDIYHPSIAALNQYSKV